MTFALVRFWAFLGKGSSKRQLKCFCKKSMSKTFPEKIDKIFDVSFSSICFRLTAFLSTFCLVRFWAFLGGGRSKTRQTKLMSPGAFLGLRETNQQYDTINDTNNQQPTTNHLKTRASFFF
jgi:hypothetical protein